MKEENFEGNLICPMMIPKPIKCKVRYEIKSPIYLKKTTSIEKKLLNQSQLFVEKGIPVFNSQIKNLMEELGETAMLGKGSGKKAESTGLHFIRCLKPNDIKEHACFYERMMLLQIQYMGVLDTIKIRRINYPNRKLYKQFYERYEFLCSKSMEKPIKILIKENADFKALSETIFKEQFNNLGKDFYLFGSTRMFMKNEIFGALEEGRNRAMKVKNLAIAKFQNSIKLLDSKKKIQQSLKKISRLFPYFRRRYSKKKLVASLKLIKKINIAKSKFKTMKRKQVEESASFILELAYKTFYISKYIYSNINVGEKIHNQACVYVVRKKILKHSFINSIVFKILINSLNIAKYRREKYLSKILNNGFKLIKISQQFSEVKTNSLNNMYL